MFFEGEAAGEVLCHSGINCLYSSNIFFAETISREGKQPDLQFFPKKQIDKRCAAKYTKANHKRGKTGDRRENQPLFSIKRG